MNSDEVKAILARGRISDEDVLMLRRRVFAKGVVTPADADMAFGLNDRLGANAAPSWAPFFVEALTDYIVNQAEPHGYISEENADWLIARISHSGKVETETELELLVKVLDRAQHSPVKLVTFALEQVKQGVIYGDGYLGRGRNLAPGAVDEAEVELLRRILYAFGGDGNIAVTQQEAAILFDINDATREAENHPAWSDLFVKALANFLMAASGYRVPTRQEALRREAWLNGPTPGVAGFMSQMLAGSLSAVWDAYQNGTLDGEPRTAAESAGAMREGSRLSEVDARWLAERMSRHGLHENEVALVNFLKRHDAHLHPRLAPILDRAVA
jgi:hypothetical protein